MISAAWSAPLAVYVWQVTLHSAIVGLIFYLWAHRVDLPSGRTKRRLLAVVLLLPLATAAVPGRASIEFGERIAWMNSARLLSVPLPLGFSAHHLVLLVAALAVALTLWQEVVPALRRRTTLTDAPDALVPNVRMLPGWANCRVSMSPADSIMIATGGWPWRPRLIISRGAIEQLDDGELQSAIVHEHAHWQAGQWTMIHALFAVRLLQAYNPVALWVFRELCIEVEIGCDAAAVAGRDPRSFARLLLQIYRSTDHRDVASKAALRKRVDVLLGGGPQDNALPPATIATAAAMMALVLPWIV